MAFPALARGGLAAHRVRRLYMFWTHKATVWVDITSTVGRKLEALRCHESQIKDFERVEAWIDEWSGQQGKEIGVKNADGFHLIVIDDDDEETPDAAASTESEAAEIV